jgi:excinuclease ABC subunit C
VGSLVCFIDGRPRRSEYRHFKIRDLEGPDDFASIHQVVQRRFRGLQEREEPFPDLLMIDGGRGQLSSAIQALAELGLQTQPVVGLAKRLEEIFLPGQTSPLLLPRTSASLRLLQMLRDEAHRFALEHHRSLRHKRTLRSALDDIPGIGPKRRTALLQAFGSVRRLRQAGVEEIAAVPGFSLKLAEEIRTFLEKGNGAADADEVGEEVESAGSHAVPVGRSVDAVVKDAESAGKDAESTGKDAVPVDRDADPVASHTEPA